MAQLAAQRKQSLGEGTRGPLGPVRASARRRRRKVGARDSRPGAPPGPEIPPAETRRFRHRARHRDRTWRRWQRPEPPTFTCRVTGSQPHLSRYSWLRPPPQSDSAGLGRGSQSARWSRPASPGRGLLPSAHARRGGPSGPPPRQPTVADDRRPPALAAPRPTLARASRSPCGADLRPGWNSASPHAREQQGGRAGTAESRSPFGTRGHLDDQSDSARLGTKPRTSVLFSGC